MIYAGKKYGPIKLWWVRVCIKLFPKGLKWFHTCRFPISTEPRKECMRLFWGTVTRSAHARGGKLGFCPKHESRVREGWARYAENQSRNREAWCATLQYACCINQFILSTDSRGTLFYIDVREWPEWDRLPESAKRERDATERYMLPIAKRKWASLSDWQWIEYETESAELKWLAEHCSAPLKGREILDELKRMPR